MAFKPGQHLSQKQKQTYIPHLVQNVQLLQLNRLELSTFLNNLIVGNPLVDLPESENQLIQRALKNSSAVIEETATSQQSLYEYLKEQVELLYRPTYLRELIFWWINQLDHKGYVTKDIDEAAAETGASSVQVLDALTLLQQLDPPGIGARSLQECLMLQTERIDFSPPTAYIILEENFDRLSHRKWKQLAEIYSISEAEVKEVLEFVQTLSPHPADAFQPSYTPFILPELSIIFEDGEMTLKETKYKTPLLSFNSSYYTELKEKNDQTIDQYIEEKKKEYENLQAGLEKRKETILRVGAAIAKHQYKFFADSKNGLVSLQLNDLAQELQLNESTVSRAVRDSYIQTKTGTYELKTFLSRRSSSGDSQHQVERHLISLIENENKAKPLSDQLLSDKLTESGVTLSRRGVTKYRKKLNIPSSTERKHTD
ncbi:MAG: RNA polymerase factor sigma-54 [Alkalibacterium sp.]|nr:RNA polymerase factor sigma-54 [Alkalibacterium sp.]